MQSAQYRADRGGDQHPEPRRPSEVRDPVAAHGPHDQCPLETEVHAATLFGEALTQAYEQERGTNAHRAGQNREWDTPKPDRTSCEFGFHQVTIALAPTAAATGGESTGRGTARKIL